MRITRPLSLHSLPRFVNSVCDSCVLQCAPEALDHAMYKWTRLGNTLHPFRAHQHFIEIRAHFDARFDEFKNCVLFFRSQFSVYARELFIYG